jgi:hypothetical protein
MTRNGRTASAGNGSASPEEASSQDALNIQGFDAARGLMSSSLESLTGMVSWLDQLQALNNSMLAGWSQALALSARDLDQAKDPEQVMALPAQMVNHHLEQTSRQLAQAMQDLFEAQVKWADRWRTQIADQMQRAMASGRQRPQAARHRWRARPVPGSMAGHDAQVDRRRGRCGASTARVPGALMR